MRINRRHVAILTMMVFLIIILVMIFLYWSKLIYLFRLLILGIIFAYVLAPVCDMLERKMPRIIAILVVFLGMLSFLSLFFIFFIPNFIDEVIVMAERFPILMESVKSILGKTQISMEELGIPDGIRDSIIDYADAFQGKATSLVTTMLDRVVSSLAHIPSLLIVPVLSFYFLKDREYFSQILKNIIPLNSRRHILQVAFEVNHILHQFIRGELFIAAVVSSMATIGYLLIGLPYALVLGVIAGIFEFIPYFGPWLGAIPAVVIAYISGPGKLLWTIIIIVLIQQLESAIITPRILGGVVELHPVFIVLSLWAGGLFFGVIGMFFAVPVVLILRVIFKHIYLNIVAIK